MKTTSTCRAIFQNRSFRKQSDTEVSLYVILTQAYEARGQQDAGAHGLRLDVSRQAKSILLD